MFKWLVNQGNVQADEAANTFNCGLGLVLVVSPENTDTVLQRVRANGEKAWVVGRMETLQSTHGQQVVIKNLAKQLEEPAFKRQPHARKRVAVLISGSGTNLQALIDASKKVCLFVPSHAREKVHSFSSYSLPFLLYESSLLLT